MISPHGDSIATHKCVYVGCNNSRKTTAHLSFFRFPVSDGPRCDQWIVNSGNRPLLNADKSVLVNKVLCEAHFTPADFKDHTSRRKLLQWNTVPLRCDDEMKYVKYGGVPPKPDGASLKVCTCGAAAKKGIQCTVCKILYHNSCGSRLKTCCNRLLLPYHGTVNVAPTIRSYSKRDDDTDENTSDSNNADNAAGDTRTMSRRTASKAALRQMQRIRNDNDVEEPETLEILSDDDNEEFHVDPAPKKKYRVTQRKSSDGPVLRTLGHGESTLSLECVVEPLSPAQTIMRNRLQKEQTEMTEKLEMILKSSNAEVIYEGTSFKAFEIVGPAPRPATTTPATKQAPNQTITIASKTAAVSAPVAPTKLQPAAAAPKANGPVATATVAAGSQSPSTASGISLVVDPRSGQVVGTVTPAPNVAPGRPGRKRGSLPAAGPPPKVIKPNNVLAPKTNESTAVPIAPKPSAPTPNSKSQPVAAVVDLTSDDGKPSADSKEVSFNKLQGKTFPSLVVVARPNLNVSMSSAAERAKLDAKVKAVLMHQPAKFTEWLIQQGLIKAEQFCTNHPSNKLKLGMYSDVSKFPFSGGYVWIAECCPNRFMSVFSGSIFEGSPHNPCVILKLIYHWACQTNVQNVIQWVKVENLYVKGLYTWLRAACTVALHSHIKILGGPGVKVEIGVISLGTTSLDGNQRQVKVEVLGILESQTNRIRLRAVEPLAENDRQYKRRFTKILEPLAPWVHQDSVIVTDVTVDKYTLNSMGFYNVQQNNANGGNQQIMDYLRRIVPRMFQNTLSLLSRQIIQQFLDELVWREWFGSSAACAFDNLLKHLSEQTKGDTGLVLRLNKVATNPFKNWSVQLQQDEPVAVKVEAPTTAKRQRRKTQIAPRTSSPTPELLKPIRSMSPDVPETMVPLENYYYGTIDGVKTGEKLNINAKCHICKEPFNNNISIMKHYFMHAHSNTNGFQCIYCLAGLSSKENLDRHIALTHPSETKVGNEYVCIICESSFQTTYQLGKHMSCEHLPSELPYQCATCTYRCSSHKEAVDHFHSEHANQGVMQCPFCLKSTIIASSNRVFPQSMHFYLNHLQKHQRKTIAKKCPKCSLWFIQKDGVKDHMKMHESQRKKAGLRPWSVPRNGIMTPKSVKDYVEEEEIDISNVVVEVADDVLCIECGVGLTTTAHFPSVLSCSNDNCQFVTCCKSTMDKHEEECQNFKLNVPPMQLPFEMFCVCGYSDTDGNLMAKHLAVCERNSAYPSMEAAKAATVTHSMLDVLGLVRRPEEPATAEKADDEKADKDDVMEVDSSDQPVVEINDSDAGEPEGETDKSPMEVDDDDDAPAEKNEVECENEKESEVDVATEKEDGDVAADKEGGDVVADKGGSDVDADKGGSDVDADKGGSDVDADKGGKDVAADDEGSDVGADKGGNDVVVDKVGTSVDGDKEGTDVDADKEGSDVEADKEGTDIGADNEGNDVATEVEGDNVTAENENDDVAADNAPAKEDDVPADKEVSSAKKDDDDPPPAEEEKSATDENELGDSAQLENHNGPIDDDDVDNLEQMINIAQEKMLTDGDDVEGLLKDIMDAECGKDSNSEVGEAMLAN